MPGRFSLYISILFLLVPSVVAADEASIFTLWPAIDYRASEAVDYTSFNLLGPVIKHETKGDEVEYALRPLFYRAVDTSSGESQTQVLYPFMTYRSDEDSAYLDIFHLFNYDFGERESGAADEFYLFPFIFSGNHPEQGSYFAIFPLGGTIYDWFGRDEIQFTLFPIYGRTRRDSTEITNVLWPIFAKVTGENESGFKFWPIYGRSQKDGHYQKNFFLWPIFFNEHLDLHTENPIRKRAAWPFYLSRESPRHSYRSYLWPFFSYEHNRVKGYEVWNAPWPLGRVTRGETRHGTRVLPFFADETTGANRRVSVMWPIYRLELTETEMFKRKRHRVLFFLYSDMFEQKYETGSEKRRVALWPLFAYNRKDAVEHFHLFALLEPFFPENDSVERLWAPLWRVYQQKWDRQGNSVVSLLWNLYWQEKQGENLALELFPLFEYRRQVVQGTDFKLLKGLLRFRSGPDGKRLNLFYLPWDFNWGGLAAEPIRS